MTATYAAHEAVATITLDDGKVNALSPAMQAAINAALDQAGDRYRGGHGKGRGAGRQRSRVQRWLRPERLRLR